MLFDFEQYSHTIFGNQTLQWNENEVFDTTARSGVIFDSIHVLIYQICDLCVYF